ncbi:GAF domain-containing sensor histidine kinase [Myxosarcina sp. GI1]|uniref:GAF domain-containing sensor histidine kinase n=1 Tax=Myxosarcina sp. GI1 TaxID=1541065 RepID=UPI00209D695E|nr:GAF domain-containing sensor histidine kinase [Myxosarcina sp. GI1]
MKSDSIEREIARIVLSECSFQAMLTKIADEIGKLFQAEACGIFANKLDSFERTSLVGCSKATVDCQTIGWWQGENFRVENQKQLIEKLSQSLFIDTKARSNESKSASCTNSGDCKIFSVEALESSVREILPTIICLGSLTKTRNETNGAIFLLKDRYSSWTDSERQLLEQLANTIAIAISQVQLQQQAQTQARFQTALSRISEKIGQNSAPEKLFETCLSEIGDALQIDRASIIKLKYQNPFKIQQSKQKVRGTVRVASQWFASEANLNLQQYSFNLQDSQLCQQALKLAPKSLAITEKAYFPDVPLEQLDNEINFDSSALLMMPLMGKTIGDSNCPLALGFLVLQHNSPRIWSDNELDLLGWVSIQIATAILHHQTLSRVQSIVDDRTSQLTHALEFQAKLTEKMRRQIEQLQKLNQLKDDFLNSMSHELKTPLTSMKMAIKMLRQQQLPPAAQEKYLNILEQEWNREYNLIKDLLTLQQVESGELALSPQELDLNLIVEPLALAFADKWQSDKGLSLKSELADSAVNLYTDADSLQYILEELLTNAGKYSDPDTTVEFSAWRVRHQEPTVAIAVSNYGTGISAEELPYIFDKFRRGKGVTDRAVQGTGLGLALVKYLVDHLNGSIEVASEPVAKSQTFVTTFTVKIPQFQAAIIDRQKI